MFNKKKQPPIKSLIAEGSSIHGNIHFSEGLRIDGEVTGDIRASAEHASLLVISESARVTGSVSADHIIISGTVKGPIAAEHMLELQPQARIEGDLQYRALEMHQGAIVSGQLRPVLEDKDKTMLKLASNNP